MRAAREERVFRADFPKLYPSCLSPCFPSHSVLSSCPQSPVRTARTNHVHRVGELQDQAGQGVEPGGGIWYDSDSGKDPSRRR